MGGALTSLSSAGADSTPPPKTASAPPLAPRSPAAAAPPPPPRTPRGPLSSPRAPRGPSSGQAGPIAIEQLNGDRQIRTYPNLMAAVHEVNAAANRGDGRLGLRGGQLTAAGLKRAAETGELCGGYHWRLPGAGGEVTPPVVKREVTPPVRRRADDPPQSRKKRRGEGDCVWALSSDEFTAVADAHSASATAAISLLALAFPGVGDIERRAAAPAEARWRAIVGHRRWRTLARRCGCCAAVYCLVDVGVPGMRRRALYCPAFVVGRASRGKGMGRRMFTQLENIARANSCELVVVSASPFARAFWSKLNFEELWLTAPIEPGGHLLFTQATLGGPADTATANLSYDLRWHNRVTEAADLGIPEPKPRS